MNCDERAFEVSRLGTMLCDGLLGPLVGRPLSILDSSREVAQNETSRSGTLFHPALRLPPPAFTLPDTHSPRHKRLRA